MKFKLGPFFLIFAILGMIGTFFFDRVYVSTFKKMFKEIEAERIVTSNKLATAKIVYENMDHVRDLVFKNMDLPGQKDSLSQESRFFDFVTTCVRDLKLELVSVKPILPVTKGRLMTFGYEIEIEGDFFKLGELCAKFENSRRIIAVENFEVELIKAGGPQKKERDRGNKGIRMKMRVNTFRVKKGV